MSNWATPYKKVITEDADYLSISVLLGTPVTSPETSPVTSPSSPQTTPRIHINSEDARIEHIVQQVHDYAIQELTKVRTWFPLSVSELGPRSHDLQAFPHAKIPRHGLQDLHDRFRDSIQTSLARLAPEFHLPSLSLSPSSFSSPSPSPLPSQTASDSGDEDEATIFVEGGHSPDQVSLPSAVSQGNLLPNHVLTHVYSVNLLTLQVPQ